MQRHTWSVRSVVLGALFLVPAPAGAVLLAYEPMNYAGIAYPVPPASNATGFSGSWRNSGVSTFRMATGSMSYTDGNSAVLPTSGNRFEADQNQGTVDFDTSLLGPFGTNGLLDGSGNIGADGTTLYMSMLLQNPAGSDGFSGMLLLTDGDANLGVTIDLSDFNAPNTGGNHGLSTDWFLDVYAHPPGPPEPDFSDPILAGPNGNQNFYVIRIDFGAGDLDTVRAYTNPLLSGEPGTPDGTLTVSGLAFDRIGFSNFGGGIREFVADEIRVGTTYSDVVPEPSAALLMLLGAGVGAALRRLTGASAPRS